MWKNRTLINAVAIYSGEALCRLTTFAVAFIVARRFSADTLGQYGYAVALASVFVLLPDMGLHLLVTRDVAADHRALPTAFWDLHELKIILVGLVVAAALAFGTLAIHDEGRRWIFYVLTIRALIQTFSSGCMAFFKALERMHFIALQQLANGAITVLGLVLCWHIKAGLYVTVSSLLVGQLVEVLLGWWFVYQHFNVGPIYGWNPNRLRTMFIAAVPIGVTTVLQAFAVRIDVLILGAFAANAEVGQFQPAALLIVVTFLATSLLMTVFFPKLVRHFRNHASTRTQFIESFIGSGLLLATCASVIVWIAAPFVIEEFFGHPMVEAARLLRILAPALPFVFVNTSMFYVFLAANRRHEYLMTLALTTGVSALLGLLLVPGMGAAGVALADLARELCASLVYFYLLHRESRIPSLSPALLKLFPGAAALALATCLLTGFEGNSQAWALTWSLTMFCGDLLLMGAPRREQLMLLAEEDL